MAKPKQILTEREKKLILALYAEGKTDLEVAKVLDIERKTFLNILEYHGINSTIRKEVKDIADKQVEKSLYDRAMGYEHPEEKIFCHEGHIIRAQTIKKYPPDPISMIFWLKNRKPEEWKDKQEVEHSGEITSLVVNVKKNYGKNG